MKELIYQFLIYIFSQLPIKKRKIFFLSYYGSQYGCNPKYLSEYMFKNCRDWIIVWGFTEPQKYHLPGIRKVKYLSLHYFYELCTSEVFVTNYRMPEHYRKRNGQLYMQTWHSSLRLKKIEGDAEYSLPPNYVKMAKRDSLQTDVLLSGCRYSTDIFERAFWYTGSIISTGTPREDLLFLKDNMKRKEVLSNLGISHDVHVVLYAPTFRKDNSLGNYNLDFQRVQNSLAAKFGGEWCVVLRLHPHLKNYSQKLIEGNPTLKDATNYDDIQELLFVSDCVISDYSSLIFDFALTKRPCFLYASDLNSYLKNDRALYFNIEDLPFPVSRDNDELNLQIQEFNQNVYISNICSFLQQVGSYETGHACENVINYILENTRQ